MQPISNPGNVSLQGEKTLETALSKTATSQTDDSPLTLAQRTTLEKLVVQISTLSGAKPAEVWATVRAELGTKNNAELLASQFPAAEQSLQNRLTTVQGSQDTRQLLQQLTSLLSQGNNRQAVSDFIRQQFGHTVLSSLTPSQLKLVVTLLQNGQLPQAATLLSTGGNTLPAVWQYRDRATDSVSPDAYRRHHTAATAANLAATGSPIASRRHSGRGHRQFIAGGDRAAGPRAVARGTQPAQPVGVKAGGADRRIAG